MDAADEVFEDSSITGIEKSGEKKQKKEEAEEDPTEDIYRSRVTKIYQNQNPKIGQNWKQPKKK